MPRFFQDVLLDLLSTGRFICWTDDGKSILIKPGFEKRLATWFKHKRMTSFVRQLNNYGFSKHNPKEMIFTNPEFTRDSPGPISSNKRKYVSNKTVLTMKEQLEEVQHELSELHKTLKRERELHQKEIEKMQDAYNTLDMAYTNFRELKTLPEPLTFSSLTINQFILKDDPWFTQ